MKKVQIKEVTSQTETLIEVVWKKCNVWSDYVFDTIRNIVPFNSRSNIQQFYDIILKEFPAYFRKCQNLIYDISQFMLKIHSKIAGSLAGGDFILDFLGYVMVGTT